MIITEPLNTALEARGTTLPLFSELMIRLLDHTVLCRNESKKEAELYDRYLQVHDLVEEYLVVLHIRILHESRFQSVRLFPPGADVPGLSDCDDSFNTGLRQRLSQQEVATILVLRAEYDKSLREGQIDEQGQVVLPMEALNLACKNLLNRPLPESTTDRRSLFRKLRQLRLIRSGNDDAMEDAEAWITIRPDITTLVTDKILAQLIEETLPAEQEPSSEIDQPSTTDIDESSFFNKLPENPPE
ncbi:DUF4194 domain-containing protein [Halioxenophilus aromaticivorans]|uniref:DUF4194 domain-containing protein n=1 Tax=Halioxenophilus aromaticivorans TaxID=1306992 RepID=A0AAV3U8C8_9ALTE